MEDVEHDQIPGTEFWRVRVSSNREQQVKDVVLCKLGDELTLWNSGQNCSAEEGD